MEEEGHTRQRHGLEFRNWNQLTATVWSGNCPTAKNTNGDESARRTTEARTGLMPLNAGRRGGIVPDYRWLTWPGGTGAHRAKVTGKLAIVLTFTLLRWPTRGKTLVTYSRVQHTIAPGIVDDVDGVPIPP